MTRAISFLANILLYLAAASLALMMFHVTLDVVGKYFFLSPIPGTTEIVANYYMIGAVFLSMAYMEISGKPIVSELLYNMVPYNLKFILMMSAYIASIVFYAMLAWYFLEVAINSYEIGDFVIAIAKVIIWPSKFFLPVGLLVACLAICLKIYELLRLGPDCVKASPERDAGGEEWTI